jgi:hypothetical protein
MCQKDLCIRRSFLFDMSKAEYRRRVNTETVRSMEAHPIWTVILFLWAYLMLAGLVSWVGISDPKLLGLAALPLVALAIRRKARKVVDLQIRLDEAFKQKVHNTPDND